MKHIYKCPYADIVDCTKRPCKERCDVCGWNPEEHEARIAAFKALKKGPDGIKHLTVKKAKEVETEVANE